MIPTDTIVPTFKLFRHSFIYIYIYIKGLPSLWQNSKFLAGEREEASIRRKTKLPLLRSPILHPRSMGQLSCLEEGNLQTREPGEYPLRRCYCGLAAWPAWSQGSISSDAIPSVNRGQKGNIWICETQSYLPQSFLSSQRHS
ncbi:hypothetical protein ACN38_g2554 [Penicillium nordicum]|uniref:Uncharacterized protein n=1 Tax=Penicillium nordicum TaxID=229535 RepID=A0A0M8P9V1_9EURO|nr:hypothetical protein ACN38_g2554 [Penicillium nordicum]